ncbi:MAG: hypothetical protein GY909_14615 [Oligoflexia bacterium]|nr:hypothetical protein [Oligoflexia bacterium]
MSSNLYAEFSRVYKKKINNRNVSFYLDYSNYKYYFDVKKDSRFSRRRSSAEFSFNEFENFDDHSHSVVDFLSDHSVKEASFHEEVKKDLEKLYFLSEERNKIIHLNVSEELIFTETKSFLNQNSRSYSSIVFTSMGEQWKLRTILDLSSKNLIGLSLVKINDEVTQYKITVDGNSLYIHSIENDNAILFKITLEKASDVINLSLSIAQRNGEKDKSVGLPFNYKIVVTDEVGIATEKLFFSIGPEMNKKDSVQLQTENAEHGAIVRIPGTNYFFNDFKLERLNEVYGFDNLNETVASLNYKHCMVNSILYGYSYTLSSEEEDYMNLCYSYVAIENILSAQGQESFKQCLVNAEVIGIVGSDSFWNNSNLYTKENLTSIKSCISNLLINQKKNEIKNIIQQRVTSSLPGINVSDSILVASQQIWEKSCNNDKFDSKECNDLLNRVIDIAVLKTYVSSLFTSDWSGTFTEKERIVNKFNKCIDEKLNKSESNFECLKDVLIDYSSEVNSTVIDELFKSLGLDSRWDSISDELRGKVVREIKDCVDYMVLDFEKSDELISEFSNILQSCRLSGVKIIAVKEYSALFLGKIGSLSKFLSDEALAKMSKELERNLNRKLDGDLTLDIMKKAIRESDVESYATFLAEVVNYNFTLKLPLAGEESDFHLRARSDVERALNQAIFLDNGKSIKKNVTTYLEDFYKKESLPGVVIATKDLLLKFFTFIRPYETVREVGRFAIGESRNQISSELDSEYKKCIEAIAPNGKSDLYSSVLSCDKKWFGSFVTVRAQRRFNDEVSYHFRLSSNKANLILSPLSYLTHCLNDIDKSNSKSLEEYKESALACTSIVHWDISYNVSSAKIDGFKPILDTNGFDPAVTSFCYNNLLLKINREGKDNPLRVALDDSNGSRSLIAMQNKVRERNPYGASILANIRTGFNWDFEYRVNDKRNMFILIDAIASNSQFNNDFFTENLSKCQKDIDDFIIAGFRNYLVKSIPGIELDEQNYKLMVDFFDAELLQLFFRFQKLNENFEVGALGGSLVPNERVITPELGLTALQNFIKVMGDYIARGFIFDKPAMRTELVVFQGELKDFLEWYLANPRNVKISEAREFFQESKLADHLAMAVVSEMVKVQFDDFLKTMKNEELEAFYRRIDCRHRNCMSDAEVSEERGIKSKYILLNSLATEMTKSYDFRRIIRPQSQQGERFVNYIKDNFLLVKIIGYNPTNRVITEIKRMAGRFIIDDKTDGGFAERFVAQVAQHHLNVQEDNKWWITKFLFYDSGDFNWRSIRNTEAGRTAIEYYGKNLLLPKVFGQRQSQYSINLHTKEFHRLLKRAQSQHDD